MATHRIALAQLQSSTDKAENLRAAKELIGEAQSKGAALVAFPEFLMAFSPGTQSAEELCALAEIIDGPFTTALRDVAKAARLNVLATIYERCASPNRVYDTALWIDRSGGIAATYRKLHLYDALGFKESDKFVAGGDLTAPVKTDLGAVGMMICYDVRFPELSRLLTLMGAEILVAPSGWVQGEMKLEHWQTMIRARALENGCYVIAPDQAGNIYIGHSMVVDPFGRIVADMGARPGLEIVELDRKILLEVREKLRLLKNRRADVYASHAWPSTNASANSNVTEEHAMILSRNAEVKALIVRYIEGKPMNGDLLVKPLLKGDQMTLLEIHYQPGVGAPLHVHSHESLAYVVKGKVRMVVGKDVYILGAGDVCRHPEGVPHSVEALEESTVVEIKSPAPDIATFLGT